MNDWYQDIQRLARLEAWDDWQDVPTGHILLSRLYEILLGAPEGLRLVRFQRQSERDIRQRVQDVGPRLDRRESDFWPQNASAEILFDRAVVAARYLDEVLAPATTPFFDAASNPFLTRDGKYYVIPVPRFRGGKGPKQAHPISKRLLLRHRVLPTDFSGIRIRLHQHDDIPGASAPQPRRVGCSIFPKPRLGEAVEDGGRTFRLTGLDVEGDMGAMIESQHADAVAAGCDTIIWPELTMPPDNVERLRQTLKAQSLRSTMPPIVVAGSWHVVDGAVWRNRSEVMDGRGVEILKFDKCVPFFDSQANRHEAIEPGNTVHLIVTKDELILPLICRDFCDESRLDLIKKCDPTCVLVPSMGVRKTCKASIDQASAVQIATGALSVVSQQVYRIEGDGDAASGEDAAAGGAMEGAPNALQAESATPEPRGYVLKAPMRPQDLTPDDCRFEGPFTTFQLR